MRIWVASYPRSGSRFSRTILKHVYGKGSQTAYLKKGDKVPLIGTVTWQGDLGPLPPSDAPLSFADCVFVKTHEPALPEDCSPALYVVRDGRDVYVSYAHFALRKRPEDAPPVKYEDMLRMLIQSQDHFSGWSRHVESWMGRSGPTAFIRYEEMAVNPGGALAKACRDIGLEPPAPVGEMPPFDEMQQGREGSMRKGETGGWREEMSPELEELFWSIHGGAMDRLGYVR